MKWEIDSEVNIEGIVVLNLIEKINDLCQGIVGERITIHINNNMVLKNIV